MRVIIHSVLALAAVLPTQAFTNGTLIPAYFCNPVPDGMPKSLGELIPFTKKDICADLAFNNNATANLKVVPVTGKQPGNTGYMLASFHNTQNAILPLQQDMAVTLAAGGTTLKAGQPNLLVLTSKVAGMALDGALIHARTNASVPVGSFKDAGGIFVAFPGCGKTKQGVFNGVVHSDLVSGNNTYTQLSYLAPKCATPGNTIILAGLSVTDSGFGVWNQTFTLSGGLPVDADGDCDGTKNKTSTTTTTIVEVIDRSSSALKIGATKPRDHMRREPIAIPNKITWRGGEAEGTW